MAVTGCGLRSVAASGRRHGWTATEGKRRGGNKLRTQARRHGRRGRGKEGVHRQTVCIHRRCALSFSPLVAACLSFPPCAALCCSCWRSASSARSPPPSHQPVRKQNNTMRERRNTDVGSPWEPTPRFSQLVELAGRCCNHAWAHPCFVLLLPSSYAVLVGCSAALSSGA